jgi:hypothetical protein
MRALVETVAPATRALDPVGWADIARLIQATLADRPWGERAQVALFLGLLEWSPALRHGRRFSGLAPARRARVLEGLSRSRLRLVRVGAWGVRTLALLGAYGRPAVWPDLGYRPDPRGWEGRA